MYKIVLKHYNTRALNNVYNCWLICGAIAYTFHKKPHKLHVLINLIMPFINIYIVKIIIEYVKTLIYICTDFYKREN